MTIKNLSLTPWEQTLFIIMVSIVTLNLYFFDLSMLDYIYLLSTNYGRWEAYTHPPTNPSFPVISSLFYIIFPLLS